MTLFQGLHEIKDAFSQSNTSECFPKKVCFLPLHEWKMLFATAVVKRAMKSSKSSKYLLCDVFMEWEGMLTT